VRPQGIKLPDSKTGELVDFLFLFRLTVIGEAYLSKVLIPALCCKAGVPAADVRGNITSHRARQRLRKVKKPKLMFSSVFPKTSSFAKLKLTGMNAMNPRQVGIQKSVCASAILCLPKISLSLPKIWSGLTAPAGSL